MKTRILSILFVLSFITSCKKTEFRVTYEPGTPLQGKEVKLKLSQNFSGYFWWLELSGGDPYKLIPHVEEIKKAKEIKIKPQEPTTSLILFAFENKDGKLKIDSTYYIIFYTKEKKPAPFALSMLGFFYFSKNAPFENLRKFSSLWLKENEYYEDHYDFMDNKYYFAIQEGAETSGEVKRKIEEKLNKEKDNPSFLHAAYLTADWVLNDTVLANRILKYFEYLPEDNYKISTYITYLRNKGIDKVASYLKEKKIDYFIKDFRYYAIFKFIYPVLETNKLIDYIREREKEEFIWLAELGTIGNILFNRKEWDKLKILIKKEKEIIEDPIKLRKHLIFSNFPPKIGNVFEVVKETQNGMYSFLSNFYLMNNKFDSSYFYIKKVVENKKPEEIDPSILELLAKSARKNQKTEEAVEAYAYLAYYYGDTKYEDTLKSILGKDYEKKIERIKKEIISKLKTVSDFEVNLTDGSRFKYSENKGKVIVLNFWATWCGPCRREIPELNELVKKFEGNKEVIFLAITDEDKRTVQNFLKKQEFLYKVAINGRKLRREFKVNAFPTHFIIDKKGKVVFKQIGYLEGTGEKLKNKIEKLLKTS